MCAGNIPGDGRVQLIRWDVRSDVGWVGIRNLLARRGSDTQDLRTITGIANEKRYY